MMTDYVNELITKIDSYESWYDDEEQELLEKLMSHLGIRRETLDDGFNYIIVGDDRILFESCDQLFDICILQAQKGE